MSTPDDRKYTESHEWIRIDGDVAVIGISAFAQDQLGDVVYVDPPEIGRVVAKGEAIAEIESVKAVSDVYAPISGEVIAVNEALEDAPETVNADAFGAGWLFQLRPSDTSELEGLLDAAGYQAHCASDA